MKWNDTTVTPKTNQKVYIVFNTYTKKEVLADGCIGIFKSHSGLVHKGCKHYTGYWEVAGLTTDDTVIIPVCDIQAWVDMDDLHRNAVQDAYTKEYHITCPYCGEKATVTANAVNIDFVEVPVVNNTLTDNLDLDFQNTDIQADVEYRCDNCGKIVGYSLADLKERYE